MFIGGVVGGMVAVGFMIIITFCWTWCHREGQYREERERLISSPQTPPPGYYCEHC